jgi:hypothetical protein
MDLNFSFSKPWHQFNKKYDALPIIISTCLFLERNPAGAYFATQSCQINQNTYWHVLSTNEMNHAVKIFA